MTCRELASEHFVVGFKETLKTASFQKWVQENRWGGYIFFTENYESPQQLHQLCQDLRKDSPVPPFLAVDQEGGPVLRFREKFTKLPAAREIGEIYGKLRNVSCAYRCGNIAAKELAAVGINWNLAPVLDTSNNPENTVIGSRAFSDKPYIVSALGLAFIAGLQDSGVMACGKHFPGHGCTSEDSHEVLPKVEHSSQRLATTEMEPFLRAIENGIFSLMTAHVLYPSLDREKPASLSKKIQTQFIRNYTRFEGILISDDMAMKAITLHQSIPEAAIEAILAGTDMVLLRGDAEAQESALEAVTQEAEKNGAFRSKLEISSHRLQRIQRDYLSKHNEYQGNLSLIGCLEHQSYIAELMEAHQETNEA